MDLCVGVLGRGHQSELGSELHLVLVHLVRHDPPAPYGEEVGG